MTEGQEYQHEVIITISTRHPEYSAEAFLSTIRLMLGPWCVDAHVVQLNGEKFPPAPASRRRAISAGMNRGSGRKEKGKR